MNRVLDARMLVPGDILRFGENCATVVSVERSCVACSVGGVGYPVFFPSFAQVRDCAVLVALGEAVKEVSS